MKLFVMSWHCSDKETEALKAVNLVHGDSFEMDDPYPLVRTLFNLGVNVAIAHGKETNKIIVSDDLFTCR